jgi:hypothetical protein
VFAASFGLPTTMFFADTSTDTGVKSFSRSYGSFCVRRNSFVRKVMLSV